MQQVLEIVDSESIGADELKKITRISSGLFQSRLSVPSIPGRDPVIYENDGVKVILRQKISMTFDTSIIEQVQNAVSEVQGVTFLNHKTRIVLPEIDDESDTFNYNNYTSDAFSYYNLRFEDYENYTVGAEERDFPSFLVGALYNRSQALEQENIYTMFGSIPALIDSEILAPGTPINNYEFDGKHVEYDSLDVDYEDTVDYFRAYYLNRDNLSLQYNNSNNHVFVDYNYNFNDSSQIGNCPFFNRISLPSQLVLPDTARKGAFSAIVNSMEESRTTDFLLKSFRQSNSFMRDFEINGSTASVKVYDLLDELDQFNINTNLKQSDELYLRESGRKHLSEVENDFLFYFYKLLAVGKLRAITKDKLFDYEKINFSDEHEKEHIGFKVTKRRQGRTTPIQTFYFLRKRSLQDFIDTQIRFNTVYTYEVTAMFLIYGSSYSYENITITGELVEGNAVPTLEFDFVNRPSFKVAEIPIATHTLRVVEPPPLVPEVQFYNEKTSKNKLKIRLEHQRGNLVNEYNRKPMRPFANNQDYIDRLKQYFSSNDIIVQSGKTSSGVYEVYRVDEPPKSYTDFEGNLIKTVQSSTIYNDGQRSRNVMFVDYIKHQRKYYYMFRVLTHQGNPSETSEVYEVEMYEDADETFLLVNSYTFPDPDYYDNNIPMRKYLQIIPNFEHTIINESNIDPTIAAEYAVENLELGLLPADESLWSFENKNKYIKLRLESKNSGRKLDLNLLFKIKKPN